MLGMMGHSMFSWLQNLVTLHYAGSYTDTFHVKILHLKYDPNSLSEELQVRCENDMKASIWVANLEKAGIFRTNNADGQVYYRDGDPVILRDTADAHAVKGFSTCRIFLRLTTTRSNTVWHTRMSVGTTNVAGGFENGGSTDTSLPTPLKINEVQTSWPGAYQRNSELPLANLGHYKILLSIK